MKRPVPIMAAALALGACGEAGNVSEPACLTTLSPNIRLPVIPGRPGSGYFQLNPEESRSPLVAVSSPRIGRIEMHETISTGNRSSMRPVRQVEADACGRITLARGGRHLMLYDIDPSLRATERVTLMLRFADGRSREIEADVLEAHTGGGH